MNILALTRGTTKPEDDEVPDLAAYQPERAPEFKPAQIDAEAGVGADVVRDLRAFARREELRAAEDALRKAYDLHGIPRGFQARRIDVNRVVRADLDENLAAVRQLLEAHPCPQLDSVVLMAVAPIVALLAEETGTEAAQ